MTTAPFHPSVAQLLPQTHDQTLRAIAVPPGHDPIPLAVDDYSIRWDENRSPRVHATLVCAVPEDAAILDLLDPRSIVRIQVLVRYRLPDGTYDEHQVADLHLRTRRVKRPENVMTLTCASDEALLIDAAPAAPYYEGVLLHDSCVAYITQTIEQLAASTPIAAPTVEVSTGPGPAFTCDAFPTDFWGCIIDAADALDASLYDNGDRVFRLAPHRYTTAESALALTVGQNGTLITSDSGVDRDQWWNSVIVMWTWLNRTSPDTPDRIWAVSKIKAGPLAPATAGRRSFFEQRQGQVTAAIAERVAQTIMRRLLARARTYELEAIAAWWVRPEDTVTITLPTGNQERHLVASVTFRTGGLMSLKTRLPDNQTVIGE